MSQSASQSAPGSPSAPAASPQGTGEASDNPAMLSINDIQNVIRVIDHAAEQGAFRGWSTIEQVLVVRNRVNEFLKTVLPPEEAQPPSAEGAANGAPAPETAPPPAPPAE